MILFMYSKYTNTQYQNNAWLNSFREMVLCTSSTACETAIIAKHFDNKVGWLIILDTWTGINKAILYSDAPLFSL